MKATNRVNGERRRVDLTRLRPRDVGILVELIDEELEQLMAQQPGADEHAWWTERWNALTRIRKLAIAGLKHVGAIRGGQ
jgi:hypothetical protein